MTYTNGFDDELPYGDRWLGIPGVPSRYGNFGNEFVEADRIEPKKISWLIPDMLPIGEVSALVGIPAVGKTTIAATLTALASNASLVQSVGENDFISADVHGKVLWVGFEDCQERTLLPRAIAAGVDRKNLAFWTTRRSHLPKNRQRSHQTSEIFQKIGSCQGVVLVVFDHADLIYTDYPDTKRGKRQALVDITELARKMGFAILVNAHYTRSATKTTSPLDRISGGSLLGQIVRKVMFVEEIQAESFDSVIQEYALFDTKVSNSGALTGLRYTIESAMIPSDGGMIETSRIKWLGRLERKQIFELESRSCKSYDRRVKISLEEAVLFVRDFLKAGPRHTSDLLAAATAARISRNLLKAAKIELGVSSRKEECAGQFSKWLCSLPQEESGPSSMLTRAEY